MEQQYDQLGRLGMFSTYKGPSLVDLAYRYPVDLWVVFTDLDTEHTSLSRSSLWYLMEPGFQHVEIWRRMSTNLWIRCDPSVEVIDVQVFNLPPWQILERLNPTVMRVRRVVTKGRWRERFHVGPMSCVELAKAFLGVSGFFIRTPLQLYNFLRKENCEKAKEA